MDGMVTPKRRRQPTFSSRSSSRRKSLFGHGIDSPEMSPETFSPPLTSPSSWSGSPAKPLDRTPIKTPIKSLQDGITQLVIEQTIDHRIGVITVQTTPKVKGVRPLSPDRGVVTPKTFYGKSTASVDLNKNLYETVKERVRRAIMFAPRANQPFQIKKRSRSSDHSVKRQPAAKTPKLSPSSKPFIKIKKSKANEKKPKIQNFQIQKKINKKVSEKKSECKKVAKPVYNWQFFNATTPTSKKSSLLNTKSLSVLTPPPSSKKRKKLLSLYDRDHLKINEDVNSMVCDFSEDEELDIPNTKRRPVINFNKSATQVEINNYGKEYSMNIAEEIADDFSENDEEELKESEICVDVDEIIEELKKDVAEALEDVPVKKLDDCGNGSINDVNKLYPIFNKSSLSKQINIDERTEELKGTSGLTRAGRDTNQLILDVGQKNLREVICSHCGLLYVKGDAVDETHHQKYHSQYRGLLFQGWKNMRITGLNGIEKIICVKSGDPKHWWQKVRDVLEIVDRELGFPEQPISSDLQVSMYVKRNKIVGCAVAKPVKYAHRVLPCDGIDTALCSEESYPVLVGISRIWVHPEHRHSGIATHLVNSIRKNYNFVKYLKIDEIAFSSPTEDGRRFAAKYCKREDYLVYTFEC